MLKSKGKKIVVLMLIMFLLLTGCTSETQEVEEEIDSDATESTVEIEQDQTILFGQALPDVVAVINGEEIPKERLIKDYNQMKALYEMYDINTDQEGMEEFIREMLINDLTNVTILLQEADRQNISISPDVIQEEVDRVKDSYESEEEFDNMLVLMDMTMDEFEQRINRQLRINGLFKHRVAEVLEDGGLDFDDEEIEQMYESIAGRLGDMPSYTEMQPRVHQIMAQNKVQIIVGDLLTQLMEDSEIEYFF